jgi:hypothetical protein
MNRLRILGGLVLAVAAAVILASVSACTEGGDGNDGEAAVDDALLDADYSTDNMVLPAADATVFFAVLFNNYKLGPLPYPWSTGNHGASRTTVVQLGGIHDKAMLIAGGILSGEYSDNFYVFKPIGENVAVSWDMFAKSSTTAYGVRIYSQIATEAWMERDIDGHFKLYRWPYGEYVDCGYTSAGAWVNVTIIFDYTTKTEHLLLNGQATSCMNMAIGGGYPIFEIEFIDWSAEGYGGLVAIDNLIARRPG